MTSKLRKTNYRAISSARFGPVLSLLPQPVPESASAGTQRAKIVVFKSYSLASALASPCQDRSFADETDVRQRAPGSRHASARSIGGTFRDTRRRDRDRRRSHGS